MDSLALLIKVTKAIFNWRVILDILLIAAGLFFLYRTLHRLGTWKIVSGILIALVVFATANILDLKGIEWIYTNVSHVAVIALIVIFQPELRKVFERAASLKGKQVEKGDSRLATILADATLALAQQRRGAIFVFPGKEPIYRWLSGGLALNADITFPLIMSIFDPNSPGHDGALIVEKGRLSRFGVRLPMSKTGSLPEEFGTRHHAAMGLSEASDALVVVVSEERGSIRIFHERKSDIAHDKNKIAAEIMSHWKNTASYASEMQRGKKRRQMISQMAVSLVLAVLFWSTVIIAQGEIREKIFSVPVVYVATPENLALAGDRPTEIKLHLTGPKSSLDAAVPAQMAAKIDLSKSVPGKQTFLITEENVDIPRGVKLLDAVPPSLTLSLVAIVEKDVPVQPQLVGKLPTGLRLKSIDIIPKKVRVLLPSPDSKEKKIVLTTTPIYLENIRESARIFCKIIAPPSVQPTDKRWPDVEVYLAVSPQ